VPLPEGIDEDARAQLERAGATGAGHRLIDVSVEDLLSAYGQSGLPAVTMGRAIGEDGDFFRAGLGAGAALADRLRLEQRGKDE
jgi:hypothetical protein